MEEYRWGGKGGKTAIEPEEEEYMSKNITSD
jgi:hypothetical protein